MVLRSAADARRSGFTLIELMIVVAIIGILAAVAIPRFAELVRKSSEGATKGSLGAVRAAIAIYYGDFQGMYPVDSLQSLVLNGKYMTALPISKTPNYHSDTSSVLAITSNTIGNYTDAGGWIYVNNMYAGTWGDFAVNCLHTDTRGSVWTSY